MDDTIDRFRQGIFSLRTNFGELAQLMLKKDMGFISADDNSYDLKSSIISSLSLSIFLFITFPP